MSQTSKGYANFLEVCAQFCSLYKSFTEDSTTSYIHVSFLTNGISFLANGITFLANGIPFLANGIPFLANGVILLANGTACLASASLMSSQGNISTQLTLLPCGYYPTRQDSYSLSCAPTVRHFTKPPPRCTVPRTLAVIL